MMHEMLDMETIHAAHNLTIELGPTSWRLFNGVQARPGALTALVEATGTGIFCAPAFARARQLPRPDLMPADIARVVVGWAPESKNWHLGFLMAARPETNYRMRWCGLASWPSGPAQDYSTPARLAGQSLARVIDRPFHLVPAATEPVSPAADTQPLEVTVPMLAVPTAADVGTITPRPAPFIFDEWTFDAIPKGYLWQQRGRSVIMAGLRAIVLGVLFVLFILLGVGAQTSGLAAVKPAWLPWLGLGVAVLMLSMAVQSLITFFTLADVIVDTGRDEIRCRSRLFGRVRWRLSFEAVKYVLLTQTSAQSLGRAPASKEDENKSAAMQIVHEAWVHLYDGQRFYEVARLGRVSGISYTWTVVRRMQQQKGRRRLHLAEYDTEAHHAAVFFADLLEAEVWLDVV